MKPFIKLFFIKIKSRNYLRIGTDIMQYVVLWFTWPVTKSAKLLSNRTFQFHEYLLRCRILLIPPCNCANCRLPGLYYRIHSVSMHTITVWCFDDLIIHLFHSFFLSLYLLSTWKYFFVFKDFHSHNWSLPKVKWRFLVHEIWTYTCIFSTYIWTYI
jgi:hypothetical protein